MKKFISSNLILGLIFIISTTFTSHFAFSHLGFNPTDDGVILALARRLLDGQVPYRDFRAETPIGSALLHLPMVFLGGEYTFWLSRLFVWFEFATIAWIWVIIITQLLKRDLNSYLKFSLALIAFVFSTHNFPIMAWYSIDGLFFLSIGLLFLQNKNFLTKMVGSIFLGYTIVTKQNFIFASIMSMILFSDIRKIRTWFLLFIPTIFFVLYLFINSALSASFSQISSISNFKSFFLRGIISYLNPIYFALGFFVGYLLMQSPPKKNSNLNELFKLAYVVILFLIPLVTVLYLGQNFFTFLLSYILFGIILGITLNAIRAKHMALFKTGIIILTCAWSISLSLGYNNPALMSGPMIVLIIERGLYFFNKYFFEKENYKLVLNLFIVLLVVVSINRFIISRKNYIYREQRAAMLTKSLDDVFPGARFIKTNFNTYEFLKDLKQNKMKVGSLPFAILPEIAGYWVKSEEENPLNTVWATVCSQEFCGVPDKKFLDPLISNIESQRGRIILILQKINASSLADGFLPISDTDYPIVTYIKTHFTKIDETKYFELYR